MLQEAFAKLKIACPSLFQRVGQKYAQIVQGRACILNGFIGIR